MRKSNTWKWTVAVAIGPVLVVTGVTWTSAQRKGAGGLSADDRAEIMHTYASYARYLDLPDVDPDAFVKRVWTADGEFVNITVKPKSGPCPGKADNPPGDWKPATLDMIKGSIPDKLGMTDNICIGVVRGYQELA